MAITWLHNTDTHLWKCALLSNNKHLNEKQKWSNAWKVLVSNVIIFWKRQTSNSSQNFSKADLKHVFWLADILRPLAVRTLLLLLFITTYTVFLSSVSQWMLLVHSQTDQFNMFTHDHNVVLRLCVKFLSNFVSPGPFVKLNIFLRKTYLLYER